MLSVCERNATHASTSQEQLSLDAVQVLGVGLWQPQQETRRAQGPVVWPGIPQVRMLASNLKLCHQRALILSPQHTQRAYNIHANEKHSIKWLHWPALHDAAVAIILYIIVCEIHWLSQLLW